MGQSEWCDIHNIEKEKEYLDDGEIKFHCPQCEYIKHQAYLKKWKDVDKERKKEERKKWRIKWL